MTDQQSKTCDRCDEPVVYRQPFRVLSHDGVHELALNLCWRHAAQRAFGPMPSSLIATFREAEL